MPQVHCENCGSKLSSPLYCESCNFLQAVNPILSYYEILGFPCSLDLDGEEIEGRIDELILLVHSDLYQREADETQRLRSEEFSAILNKIKETFSNPFQKYRYFLSLFSEEPELNLNKYKLSNEFLTHVSKIQECLEQYNVSKETISKSFQLVHDISVETIKSLRCLQKENNCDNFKRACILLNQFKFAKDIEEKIPD